MTAPLDDAALERWNQLARAAEDGAFAIPGAKMTEAHTRFGVNAPMIVLALIAEVRRLRELVEDAYTEGATDALYSGSFDRWERSNARKALEPGA